jgi:glycine hydroxymethyltransferase
MMGASAELPAPRGGGTLAQAIQRGVFPFVQGAPIVNSIAAKARALGHAATPEFTELMKQVVALARTLAAELVERGHRVISGGTDNHIVVVDVLTSFGLTGVIAEKALEECGIIVNKNRIVGDTRPPTISSGIRVGTNTLAARRLPAREMRHCADLVIRVLSATRPLDDHRYELPASVRQDVAEEVRSTCRRFPIPGYAS